MSTIHSIKVEVFGDFTSVMRDTQNLANSTNQTVSFKWNSVNFSVHGGEQINDLWVYYQRKLNGG